jgi:sporulation and cell division protein SsgA
VTAVVVPAIFRYAADGTRTDGLLTYDTDDPYAVTVAIPEQPNSPWVFARYLLAAGLRARSSYVGDGDARIGPADAPDYAMLVLLAAEPGDEHAALLMPRHRVSWFLARTYSLVPVGKEQVDVDGCIAKILQGATS